MIRSIIIEDELLAISALKQELVLHCPEIKVVDTAQNIIDGIKVIEANQPDLVFLDIQLSDGLGFEVLQHFYKVKFKVIFTTAYSKYALQAIKFSALDYLLKPIDSNELKMAIYKVINDKQENFKDKIETFLLNQKEKSYRKKIVLQTSTGVYIHEISTIIKCSSDGNYTSIYFTNGKKLLVPKTLKNLEELLVPLNFERIHHSHLINIDHLTSYINKDGGYVILSDKTTLPVSQRKRSTLMKRLEKFNKLN